MEIVLPAVNLSAILPEIVLIATAVIVLLVQFVKRVAIGNLESILSLVGILLAGGLVVTRFNDPTVTAFSQTWLDDNYARIFKSIFLLGTGLSILLYIRYAEQEGLPEAEYYFLMLCATVGMMAMAGANDLITIFLAIELLSICLYILAGIAKTKAVSIEASMKYFILGSFATGFLLYGMAFVYGITGTTNLNDIKSAIDTVDSNRPLLLIGMVLLLTGFGFKIAAVPFHMWTPDVYEGAPAPVTAFMSIGPKAAALAALIRVLVVAFSSLHINWTMLLWIISVLTMTLGNIIALKQESVKRMLGYSSIAHVGYVLIGFVAVTENGVSAIIFYLAAYAFMNIGAFTVVILVARRGETRTRYQDYAGLFKAHPWLAVTMTLFMISLAGIPPTAGFMGKFYLFYAAVQADFVVLALIGAVNSVISVYYYLRVTVLMFMKDPEGEILPINFSPSMIIALLIAIYGVIHLGIAPSGYMTISRSALLFF